MNKDKTFFFTYMRWLYIILFFKVLTGMSLSSKALKITHDIHESFSIFKTRLN